MNLFSGNFLFNTPSNLSPWFTVLTVAFAVLLIGCVFAWWQRTRLAPENPVRRRLIRRMAKTFGWDAVVALFLCAMIYLQVDYAAMPFWLYLLGIVMIAQVGFYVYELSERYPLAVHQLETSHVERRYRPQAKRREEPRVQRPAGVKGKRRNTARR